MFNVSQHILFAPSSFGENVPTAPSLAQQIQALPSPPKHAPGYPTNLANMQLMYEVKKWKAKQPVKLIVKTPPKELEEHYFKVIKILTGNQWILTRQNMEIAIDAYLKDKGYRNDLDQLKRDLMERLTKDYPA